MLRIEWLANSALQNTLKLFSVIAVKHGIDIHGSAWKANEEVRILPRDFGGNPSCTSFCHI